jgi:putative Mn2+ efflux pump MntP
MFWIEALFVRVPVARRLREQLLLRLVFLFLVWFSGFVAFAVDGLGAAYVSDVQLYLTFFGSGFIIMFGAYMIQESLGSTVRSLRPLLRLDDSRFKKFFERMELYTFSFVPNLLIALLFTFIVPGNRITLVQLTNAVESVHLAWTVGLVLFFNLLSATGIWMGVSIWLTIFLISRQPLQVELSSRTAREFRGLANLALYFSAFYFLAMAIGWVIPLSSAPIVSWRDVVLSPLFIYIVIGALGILLPFYNIHRTLVALKRRELLQIEEEFELMQRQLNDVQKEPEHRIGDQSLVLLDRLFCLQIRERKARASKEWPVDIGFVSKLAGLIAAPAAARILPEILRMLNL